LWRYYWVLQQIKTHLHTYTVQPTYDFSNKFNVLTFRNSTYSQEFIFNFLDPIQLLFSILTKAQSMVWFMVWFFYRSTKMVLGWVYLGHKNLNPYVIIKSCHVFPHFFFSSFLWDNLQWNLMACVRSPLMGQHDLTTFCKPIMISLKKFKHTFYFL